jgi:hypothetical protein
MTVVIYLDGAPMRVPAGFLAREEDVRDALGIAKDTVIRYDGSKCTFERGWSFGEGEHYTIDDAALDDLRDALAEGCEVCPESEEDSFPNDMDWRGSEQGPDDWK